VGEAMIGFEGRFHVKQCMPGKSVKRGIKAWSLADSCNVYLLLYHIYVGKKKPKAESIVGRTSDNK
jgi:hypothetical protein